jgi:hypothetical protein
MLDLDEPMGFHLLESAQQILHVAFNLSIAGSVAQALRRMKPNARATGLIDDLSFGPVDFPTPIARADWVEDVVGHEWLETVQRAEFFWREAI